MKRERKYINKRIFIKAILLIVSFVLILSYMHVATTNDEKFTLMLVNNKFSNLIKLDSLDVHPPFYYIILKYFLFITTFWTKSLSIKIIFSRILSLGFAIGTFIYLNKILKFCHINLNWVYEWLIYISLPNVLSSLNVYSTSPIVNIRMYSLASLIIVMEFYYLLEFSSNSDAICLMILFTLSMYTHYFAAIISFALMITFSIYYIKSNKKLLLKRLIISFFIACLFYLPWMPYLYKQITIPNGTYDLSNIGFIKAASKFFIFVLILIVPVIYGVCNSHSKRLKLVLYEICGSLLLTFLLALAVSFIVQPVFDNRYVYPILLIYEFCSLNILFKYMLFYKSFCLKGYITLIICVLGLNMISSTYYQFANIDIPYERINRNITNILKKRKRIIYLKRINNTKDIDGTPINLEYTFRLINTNKLVNTNDNFKLKSKLVNRKLFEPVYSHIRSSSDN